MTDFYEKLDKLKESHANLPEYTNIIEIVVSRDFYMALARHELKYVSAHLPQSHQTIFGITLLVKDKVPYDWSIKIARDNKIQYIVHFDYRVVTFYEPESLNSLGRYGRPVVSPSFDGLIPNPFAL